VRRHEGVVMVPALNGLGAPAWISAPGVPCSDWPEAPSGPNLVRAVLEGVAQRGADLVDAAQADTGLSITELR